MRVEACMLPRLPAARSVRARHAGQSTRRTRAQARQEEDRCSRSKPNKGACCRCQSPSWRPARDAALVIPAARRQRWHAGVATGDRRPDRYACEPKVDGVRGLVGLPAGRVMEMRNRRGEKRDWLRSDVFRGWPPSPRGPTPEPLGRDGASTASLPRPVRGHDVGAARIEEVATIAPVRRIRRAGAARRGPSWPRSVDVGILTVGSPGSRPGRPGTNWPQ
jgi:hypothetical protein